jgi:hypothetical protein
MDDYAPALDYSGIYRYLILLVTFPVWLDTILKVSE